MNATDIIRKKRDGEELSSDEIAYIIQGFTKDTVPDYQMSSFLMSVFFKGMSPKEVFELTDSMLRSGETVDLKEIDGFKVDKHSTGGVGDKISIILAPLVASCGLTVPMISGRGLGHSGGTLDKLESIPGFKVQIPIEEFKSTLKNIGLSLIGQTKTLVPADKKIYALRDVTATVESIPLITASILSKKLAEGIDGLVMDVKVGSGAFMKTLDDARKLASSIKNVMQIFEKSIVCLLTDMDQPLGNEIGNSLEIKESIDVLKGGGPQDVIELTLELSSHMLRLGGIGKDLSEAKDISSKNLKNGKALEKFKELIEYQGGDPKVIDNPEIMGNSKFIKDIKLGKNGYISNIESESLGLSLVRLGAGRTKTSDPVDHTVGITLNKKVGDQLGKNDYIATVHYNNERKFDEEYEKIKNCFTTTLKAPTKKDLILDAII